MENHDAGDVLPEIADEDKIFKSRLYFHQVTVGEVEPDFLDVRGEIKGPAAVCFLSLPP